MSTKRKTHETEENMEINLKEIALKVSTNKQGSSTIAADHVLLSKEADK